MRLLLSIGLLAGAFLSSAFLAAASSSEPEWREPWQSKLTGWFKTLKEDDVAFHEKAFDWSKLDASETRRNHHLSVGGYPPLWIAMSAMKLPAEGFLWSGLWHEEGEPQRALEPYGISQGQMWIPSSPTTANSLAWLYGWNRPWNAYYQDRTVALRAAIISMIDLIMIRENVHFYTSGEEGCRQPPFPPRACESGFSLTFNAYTFIQVKDALPPEVREAWAEGLRWYANYNATGRLAGPENMQLSVPVGITYAGIGLNDDDLKRKGGEIMEKLLVTYFSPAGYIRDAGVPDGSYNGISLHRLAEYFAISDSPRVLKVLSQAYDLKQALTLPEPDGSTLSPSHFNARCKDGFDFDQYQGREVLFLEEVPAAGFYLRKAWPEVDVEAQGQRIANQLRRDFSRLAQPKAWASNHRWDGVLSLPYLAYHGDDEKAMDAIIRANENPLLIQQDRFTKNFGDEFYVVRRPAYAAVFYAGPAVPHDTGATNHAAMLNKEGGFLMGFGGGGLSAFWTPQSSTVLLGRLTGYEAYDRQTKSFKWGDYILSGWQDWLSNHIVGETSEGKVLTSARTAQPRSRLVENDSKLEIRGEIPRQTRKQGDIIDARLTYQRTYTFEDDGIDCVVELATDKPATLKSLFEAIPVLTGQKNNRQAQEYVGETTWRFIGVDGKPVEPTPIELPTGKFVFETANRNPVTNQEEIVARVEGVKILELHRYDGGAVIRFAEPVNFSLSAVEVTSSQMTFTKGRALLIELPTDLKPGQPVQLRYRLEPLPPKTFAAQPPPQQTENHE